MLMNDHDPVETQEWVDSLRAVLQYQGPERARYLLTKLREEALRTGAMPPVPGHDAVPQHDPARAGGEVAGQPRARAQDPRRDPLERGGDHPAREQGVLRARRPHRELPVRRRRSTTSASTISGMRRPTSHGGDLLYVQGHVVARHLRARLHRRPAHRGAAAQLPPGGRRQGHLRRIRIRG